MNIVPPDEGARGCTPLDEAQWQCATNEGWPDRERMRASIPPGAIAPLAALEAPSNVVDLSAWRRAHVAGLSVVRRHGDAG